MGPGGRATSRWAIFCKFLEKNGLEKKGKFLENWKKKGKFLEKITILMPFGSHFARLKSHLKEQNF